MYKIVYFNIMRVALGIFCVWAGGLLCGLAVVILSVFSFAYGCYELKHIEELETFKNKPYCYANFVVGFDLLFPVALVISLILYRRGI